jgi:hypothetical protein
MRASAAPVVLALLAPGACGGAVADDGTEDASDATGDGAETGPEPVACDVYDGPDAFVACVCANSKPCSLGRPDECAAIVEPTLRDFVRSDGLDCIQAIGDLFRCENELTCPQYHQLNDYWSSCWDLDPDGSEQPYCAEQTWAMAAACPSIGGIPCG